MAQLARTDITKELHGSTICITVRRGKVVPKIGPYTLHMSASSPLAQALYAATKTSRGEFVFSTSNTLKERAHLALRAGASF